MSTITPSAHRKGGIEMRQHQDTLHVDVSALWGPELMRIEQVADAELEEVGETLHRLHLRPHAERSGELWVTLSARDWARLRDLIDTHLSETERRTDGLRPTTVDA